MGHILREDQKIQILRDIIQHIDVEMDDSGDFITDIAGEISFVKGDGISLEHYYAKNCSDEVFRSIFREYERRLSALHRIDFDDMLVKTYRLFKERPDILAAWQKKYQYILIDEFRTSTVCSLRSSRCWLCRKTIFLSWGMTTNLFTVSAVQNPKFC